MIQVGSHPAWHPVFETLAYAAGYGLYRHLRNQSGDVIDDGQRWLVIAAAAVGALLGSRGLGLAEEWPSIASAYRSGHLLALLIFSGGKTIVGGLLGGWAAVEVVKKFGGIGYRTGDLFAVPLCVGIAVGRIGCFLAGLADDTYGTVSHLPWAVNLGDGVPRHPVQLYEIVFLILLALWLSRSAGWHEGDRFRVFLAAYLCWRLLVDFLKPEPLVAGLNLVQWACITGLAVLAAALVPGLRSRRGKGQAKEVFG